MYSPALQKHSLPAEMTCSLLSQGTSTSTSSKASPPWPYAFTPFSVYPNPTFPTTSSFKDICLLQASLTITVPWS